MKLAIVFESSWLRGWNEPFIAFTDLYDWLNGSHDYQILVDRTTQPVTIYLKNPESTQDFPK